MGNKKPGLIILLAIVGSILFLLSIPFLWSGLSGVSSIFIMVSLALMLAGLIGLWSFRKWGLVVYAVAVAIDQMVLIVWGSWSMLSLILPVLVVLAFIQFKKLK